MANNVGLAGGANPPEGGVTVADLIEWLQAQDPKMRVVFQMYSEQCLLELEQLDVQRLGVARPDGWVHDWRADKAAETYVVFPGN